MKHSTKAQVHVNPQIIPMIDIMFLLLLFFMLGADMGHRELEDVRLPRAKADGCKGESATLTVNCYHDAPSCAEYTVAMVCGNDGHWRIGIRGVDCTPA